jgi:pimeloyl-ACP methyl ester carboxylesterase
VFVALRRRDGSYDWEVDAMDAGAQIARSQDIGEKIARVARKRTEIAQKHFNERVQEAVDGKDWLAAMVPTTVALLNPWMAWQYAVDASQRAILFWDTLRERGNEYIELSAQTSKSVLHFDFEIILDARDFDRPVNYALLKIKPPEGVTVDAANRPYVIIDPRAGHGPGIGGFKDDSQVGVALRAGHPVYFVVFFRDPEPGQTLIDVCTAEHIFIKKVRSMHPKSPKPAIVGNCQGGWAAMMLASSGPEDTGPVVINGAPMSYWSGAWSEGEGDNPMRYAGGLLGGTWLASLTADAGNGKFDGAHLVQNFENLNPANTLWDKYRHLYANIDTEPPRFLEFERWWGGYYLMNREEIEWITRNLFVGNKLWTGEVKGAGGKGFDLREIRSPIILFASMGDNITPPQQAFNWVSDLYESTEEIKARGQVIVGLMHRDIGHLGIFVSGKVAKKEHSQIVNVLETIESFPPGLYGMSISERRDGGDGAIQYDVEFREFRLEEVAARLNRFERADEKPFEAVEEASEFNQLAYELFLQPFVQAMSNEASARMMREFHPLRVQRWSFSELNPWLAWLPYAAKAVKEHRQALDQDHPIRKGEQTVSDAISASLDYYRALRDAGTEALFFATYANMFSLFLAERHTEHERKRRVSADSRDLPFVKEALDSITEGGYTEAIARVAFLVARKGEPLPLTRLALRQELAKSYAEYLPALPADQWRRVRGEQEIIAAYEPEQAIATLPMLLAERADRKRLLTLVEKLLADERVQEVKPTKEQLTMLDRIRNVLAQKAPREQPAALDRS